MKLQSLRSLFTLLGSLAIGLPAARADILPIPLLGSQIEAMPYRFNGLIIANGTRMGSGSVVGHPNIVLSCAHVPYDSDFGSNPWLGNVYWFWKPHGSDFENWPEPQTFRGYTRFSGYQFMEESRGDGYPGGWIFDFVAYYAFENLAGGGFGGVWTNGVAVLSTAGPKMVTGYPSGFYPEGHADAYKMHVTGPFSMPLEVDRGPNLRVDGATIGSGNSGGPIWVQDIGSGSWLTAGVVITAVNKLEGGPLNSIGVRAIDADAWALVADALRVTAPQNDDFAGSIRISGIPLSVTGSNVGGDKEVNEPDHAEEPGGHSVWWSWTAPSSQRVTVDTVGSRFDTVLAVYTGTGYSNLNPIESDVGSVDGNASRVTFSAVSGTTYHIVVDAYASVGGNIVLNISAPPPNDDFSGRIALTGSIVSVTGSNVGAGKQNGEPDHADEPGGKSVWWTWTPTVAGIVTIDTHGSGFDSLLAVYTGDSVSALTSVASNNDGDYRMTSMLTFAAGIGKTYHIAVDGLEGEVGLITLNIHQGLNVRSQPESSTTAVGGSAYFGVTAGGAATLRYQWKRDGLDLPGTTNSYLSITNIQITNAGAYSVWISDGTNTALSASATLKVIPAYTFVTVAGTPRSGSADGQGEAAGFNLPGGVAVDHAGNVYVADSANDTIRKITPDGVVSTRAGSPGINGNANGAGNVARFSFPLGVAVDNAGNLYVADFYNYQIRKIAPDGTVTSFAGSTRGTPGTNDATGSLARFYGPSSLAADGAGNLYVADTYNHTIRKITPQAVVSTVAGKAGTRGSLDGQGNAARFAYPLGIAVDTSGNLYVSDSGNATIRKITLGGSVSTLAGSPGNTGTTDGFGPGAWFIDPTGIGVDSLGNVYVADSVAHTIRKIDPQGNTSTWAGTAGRNGHANGPLATATFDSPTGLAVDASGAVYVTDAGNQAIRVIHPSGSVSTLAGKSGMGGADGSGSQASFASLDGMAVDDSGWVYVADTGNHTVRKISPDGVVSTLAGMSGMTGTADGQGSEARFDNPESPAVDQEGNVYVADAWNHTIRKITPNGFVSTLAGSAGNHGSADGPASAARFFYPFAVAVDRAGVVYVADGLNHTIRKISTDGFVSTLAGTAGEYGHADGRGNTARFSGPEGVAVDAAGFVYVADFGNHVIRKITPDGMVSTFAGWAGEAGGWDGTGTDAGFDGPTGVAVDAGGNLLVSDSGNNSIRMITPAGVVSTLAGSLWDRAGNVNGTGAAVRFSSPYGVAVDKQGNVYLSDSGNNIVRRGSPQIVAKKTQTIDFAALDRRVFGEAPFAVAAAASSGLPVQFRIVSGPAALSGNLVAVTGAGTVTLRASQPGNTEYDAAPDLDQSFEVAKAQQSITFGPIGDRFLGSAPFNLIASASSGLPVTFVVVSGPAALSGATVTLTGSGVVTVRASQEGDLNFAAATSQDQSFMVAANNPPPTASLRVASVTAAGGSFVELLVTYSGDTAIQQDSLDSKDIRVTGPNGFNELAVLAWFDWGASRTVAYRIVAPGGAWSSAANGVYTVQMEPNQVSDTSNAFVVSGVLGTFQVNVPIPPPIIVTQPQSQAVTSGTNVTFSVVAMGAGPLVYQWRLNELPIAGATSAELLLRDVQANAAGAYTVMISVSGASVTSAVATLTVNPLVVIEAPRITEQPKSQTVKVGDAVTLSVVAAGTEPLAVQWHLNGSPIAGATAAELLLRDVQPSAAGAYTVVISNSAASVTSDVATLTVNPLVVIEAPRITEQPKSQTVKVGDAVTLSVVAAGTEPLAMQWHLNGSPIPGATAAELLLRDVQANAAGAYTVVISNSAASVTSDVATLTVNPLVVIEAPRITEQPKSQTVKVGDAVTLSVVAAGTEPLAVQWHLNGSPIAGATSAELSLRDVQPSAAGAYTVVISNSASSVTSDVATLTVNPLVVIEAPRITEQPKSQTVTSGTNVTFTVVATGTEPLVVQWHLNGSLIAGATSAELSLRDVQPSAAGAYTVVISNSASSVTSDVATLTVNPLVVVEAPRITEQPRSQTVNVGDTVTFIVTSIGTAPLAYLWQFNDAPLSGATSSTLILTNVQTSSAGSYAVVVSNEGGQMLSTRAELTVLVPPPIVIRPPNDEFLNRIPLSGAAVSVEGSNIDASQEAGEANHAGKPAAKSVWWSWTPSQSGLVTVSTADSGIDTLLGIYTGSTVSELASVASNDDDPAGGSTSLLSFQAQAATEYQIAVDAFGGEAGLIKLKILLEIPKPLLRVEASGRNLILVWATNHVGFIIEAADHLASPVWTPISLTPVVIGESYSAKIPMQSELKFYRLREKP